MTDYDRNLEHLHGDDLTWALHRQNRADTAILKARVNLLVWMIGLLIAGGIGAFGWLMTHPG